MCIKKAPCSKRNKELNKYAARDGGLPPVCLARIENGNAAFFSYWEYLSLKWGKCQGRDCGRGAPPQGDYSGFSQAA
jgi:hypothetical protein